MNKPEPGWLVKDFNILYRVVSDLLLAVGSGDESRTARALDAVAAQMTRLRPAFQYTEMARGVGGLVSEIAIGLGATPEDIAAVVAKMEEDRRKGSG